ncbi:MAG: L,D-transpeptidase family protein [Acidobacteria bacterium]|nr:L,D-transpeptidase family protein [Acidobacteriota bacterium]
MIASTTGTAIIGEVDRYEVMTGDTLGLVAARFGIEPAVLARDNNLKTNARLKPGDTLAVDNRHIVPSGFTDGIVVNLPQRRLFLFRDGEVQQSYPVAVGTGSWKTPTGEFAIQSLEVDPAWDVPKSIQAEMARKGKRVLTRVAPGPDNPLGSRWIGVNGSIGIHGTNAPSSIFKFATHGCVRMATEDVEHLFELLQKGDRVAFIYEPVLVARQGDDVFVEVHTDPYARGGVTREAIASRLEAVGAGAFASHPGIDVALKAREGRARELPVHTLAADTAPRGAR